MPMLLQLFAGVSPPLSGCNGVRAREAQLLVAFNGPLLAH